MAKYTKRNTGLKIFLALKASAVQLLAIVVFFACGYLYFTIAHPTWDVFIRIEATAFVQTDQIKSDPIGTMYGVIGSVVITQGILAVITNRVQQTFNSQKMAQIFAQHAKHHVIVLGFGHLGKLVLEWCQHHKAEVVVIEKKQSKVDAIIDAGFPVIIGDVSEDGILEMAHVESAHDIIQTFNDIRTSLVLAHDARKMSPKCDFWTRCHDDKIQAVLAEMGAKPFSTSAWICNKLLDELPPTTSSIVLVGYNNICERFAENFARTGRSFVIIEHEPKNVELLRALNYPYVEGDATILNILQDPRVTGCDAAILCEEDKEREAILMIHNLLLVNPKISIFVRIYDDEIAKVMEGMGARTFSSSKFAFEKLVPDIMH